MLVKDGLALGSISEVVIAEMDAASVQRHTVGEALVLGKVSMVDIKVGSRARIILTSFI